MGSGSQLNCLALTPAPIFARSPETSLRVLSFPQHRHLRLHHLDMQSGRLGSADGTLRAAKGLLRLSLGRICSNMPPLLIGGRAGTAPENFRYQHGLVPSLTCASSQGCPRGLPREMHLAAARSPHNLVLEHILRPPEGGRGFHGVHTAVCLTAHFRHQVIKCLGRQECTRVRQFSLPRHRRQGRQGNALGANWADPARLQ